jgi:hypothetical protein
VAARHGVSVITTAYETPDHLPTVFGGIPNLAELAVELSPATTQLLDTYNAKAKAILNDRRGNGDERAGRIDLLILRHNGQCTQEEYTKKMQEWLHLALFEKTPDETAKDGRLMRNKRTRPFQYASTLDLDNLLWHTVAEPEHRCEAWRLVTNLRYGQATIGRYVAKARVFRMYVETV